METCVSPPSQQSRAAEDDTEQENKGLTSHQQALDNSTDSIPTPAFTTLKSSTLSLSDLIPAAAEALRTRHHLQRSATTTSCSSDTPYVSVSTPSSSLNSQQPATNTSPFARALTKVKLQVQTKRLKERYLGHEWIRLALGLPVDLSRINLHHCYYSREQLDRKKAATHTSVTDTLPSPSFSPPPSPAPSHSNSTILIDSGPKKLDWSLDTTPPVSPSSSRTGEIATWYEWKIDRSKFTIDEIQTKVDRLRTTKLRDKMASPSS